MRRPTTLRRPAPQILTLALAAGCLALPAMAVAADAPTALNELADRYMALRLKADPTVAYQAGLSIASHAGLPEISPAAEKANAAAEDRLWEQLHKIQTSSLTDPAARSTYANLEQALGDLRRGRVCHQSWWAVNHFTGWQAGLGVVAQKQPVGTAKLRAEALQRWSALPAFLQQHTANLRTGLAASYSAPKAVVRRVIQQLDGLLALPVEKTPFYSMATRDSDPAFQQALRKLIETKLLPAVREHRQFLNDTYLPKARDELGVSALPNGAACYQAMLRESTTLERTPQQVHDLGRKTVDANRADILEIGGKLFGTNSFEEIVKRNAEAPENKFASEAELVEYSNQVMARAIERSRPLFLKLPDQPVVIEPTPAYLAGSGEAARYVADNDVTKPGKYVIPAYEWKHETRGSADVTVVHETIPGHHMQIAFAREHKSRLGGLTDNGAYVEGWARYSERLGEEAGIYQLPYARITRRVWPAWGMIVDPGIHALGWTRQQAVDALVSSTRFNAEQAEQLVDRIASMPGQLTSYDSGGLEIFALRREAEATLGDKFNVQRFHQRILAMGSVPLQALGEDIRAWIKAGGA